MPAMEVPTACSTRLKFKEALVIRNFGLPSMGPMGR